MTKRPFGKTGLEVSPLGFGAAPAAFLNPSASRTADMLNTLLDAGMNVIDTAAMYPGSEKFIGDHLSHRREDFVLVSKCGTKVDEISAPEWSRLLILQSVDRALRLARTDVIDVMLLHTCDLKTLQAGDALNALVDARKAGKIRFAGYSGDNDAVAWAAARPDVAVVEMSINIVDQVNIDHGLAVASNNNVGVVVKRPMANGCWKDPELQPGMYRNYSKPYTQRLAQMNLQPSDLGGLDWPELALRFTLAQPGAHTMVVGTTSPMNARANLDAVNKGPLPSEFVQRIRAAFRDGDPNGKWLGLT